MLTEPARPEDRPAIVRDWTGAWEAERAELGDLAGRRVAVALRQRVAVYAALDDGVVHVFDVGTPDLLSRLRGRPAGAESVTIVTGVFDSAARVVAGAAQRLNPSLSVRTVDELIYGVVRCAHAHLVAGRVRVDTYGLAALTAWKRCDGTAGYDLDHVFALGLLAYEASRPYERGGACR